MRPDVDLIERFHKLGGSFPTRPSDDVPEPKTQMPRIVFGEAQLYERVERCTKRVS